MAIIIIVEWFILLLIDFIKAITFLFMEEFMKNFTYLLVFILVSSICVPVFADDSIYVCRNPFDFIMCFYGYTCLSDGNYKCV